MLYFQKIKTGEPMSFRSAIQALDSRGELRHISKPISKTFEIAGVLKALEPKTVVFDNVKESAFQVVGNVMCTKTNLADYLGIPVQSLIPTLTNAIENPTKPTMVENAPCQEVVNLTPDLDTLPIPLHFEGDGGNYITSGVMVAKHPIHGQNLDFHRLMQFSKTEMAVRVVKSRHFDIFLEDLGQVDVAICIGVSPAVMIAAATSVALGQDELEIANSLESFEVVRAKTVDLLIPAESEFVIEGTIYRHHHALF